VPYALQKDDAASMFSVYRKLVHLREASPILRFGEISALDATANNQKLLGYVRTYEGKNLIVIHNLAQQPVMVALTAGKTVLYEHGGASLKDGLATLPAYSSIVIGE
ncbi:MAG: DUF3459 domain-containing protein, partial [Erysipelotrichaceae bacterium]